MNHDNMNDLLALYFHEGHNRQIKETTEHVKQCSICQNYLSDIERIDQKFNLAGLTSDETLLYLDHRLHQGGSSFQACK